MTAVVFPIMRSHDLYTVLLFVKGVHSFMEKLEEKLSENTCQNPKFIRGMLEFYLSQKTGHEERVASIRKKINK